MKAPKSPTPLQLFKQWKKYELASDKARAEKRLLEEMTHEAVNMHRTHVTVNGSIYELNVRRGNNSWNSSLDIKRLGSVEEFANLIK
jgi:CYTH domain-containing protein